MNPRQKQFVKEYLLEPNATKAAIAAGYSERTAYQIGSRLLKNVEVQQEINKTTQKLAAKLDLTTEKVLTELSHLGFSNMLDYITVQDSDAFVDLSRMTREQAAAIQEITVEDYKDGRGESARDIRKVKFRLAEKRGALELLGKHLRLFGAEGNGNPTNIQFVITR